MKARPTGNSTKVHWKITHPNVDNINKDNFDNIITNFLSIIQNDRTNENIFPHQSQ